MSDLNQRMRALDVSTSCIVQAPAGSGKTELLIQRMLALLAQVNHPKEILAITFTNKAASEMRERIVKALKSAASESAPLEDHKLKTWDLARNVLARHGDSLLRNPGQMLVQTIDSFNASLVRKMPWLSRFGAVPEVSEDPDSLYQEAVEKLVDRLSQDSGNASLRRLLGHLDNQVQELQRLLVQMLRQRDQWIELLLQHDETTERFLQASVERYCLDELGRLTRSIPDGLVEEILWCARFSSAHRDDTSLTFDFMPGENLSDTERWLFLSDLLLTSSGSVRKKVTVSNGFPPGGAYQDAKSRMLRLLEACDAEDAFIMCLRRVRTLPLEGYSDLQWEILQSLIELLPLLAAELWLVFRAHGKVDFSEIALKAIDSLGRSESPSDLLLKIDHNLKHILVDEFQDTSRLQYRLLTLLTSGWSSGDNRTLFLVGDPMQSIYRFREAEVGLFLQSFSGSFGPLNLPLKTLRLSSNFRSQQGVVDWINDSFSAIFPVQENSLTGAVPLSRADAANPLTKGRAVQFYPFLGRNDRVEAEQVVAIVKAAKSDDPKQTVAILVRSRTHLAEILPHLKASGLNFQSQDIDLLGAKPAVLDVVHLTRALLHRGDRLSWLAVLRAPWCGLTLKDLSVLFDASGRTIPNQIYDSELSTRLSDDGRKRLDRVRPVLASALKKRGRVPVRELVEGCWLSLGGADCYGHTALLDIQRVFRLLEDLDAGGDIVSLSQIERSLLTLFSEPDSDSDGTLQIMTIHKAKGLEFDSVIIPGLGKKPRHQDQPLLRWFDHPEYGLMMAALSEKGTKQKNQLYQMLARIDAEQGAEEDARLLYVATTRAINRLHLLAHARVNSQRQPRPEKGSLLEKMWPVVADQFDGLDEQEPQDDAEVTIPRLKRLPSDWEPCLMTPALLKSGPVTVIPSETHTEESDRNYFSGWEDPVHRIVGTEVHRQLEWLIVQGCDSWDQEHPEARHTRIMRALRSAGVSGDALELSTKKVLTAVRTCLESQKGRWILQQHEGHQTEMPITGLVDGRLVHAVVDRFFIDDGNGWIIDFKVTSPGVDESLDSFYRRQADQYKKQLDTYAQLLSSLKKGLAVRTALYFPLIDGWYELT